jgi:hypothetical protein
MDYQSFLAGKKTYADPCGFRVDPDKLPQCLKPFQRDAVGYLLRVGRGGAFEECGLGKTLQQLSWSIATVQKAGGLALILCPLAVAGQTLREAKRFGLDQMGVPIGVYAAGDQIPYTQGIAITNYEKLHHFDASKFAAVALDESSILKSFTGKTKQALCSAFAETPYRSAWTATPSPNDLLELGNHSEFLGAMPSSEMISRWFINDSMQVGKYRLKGHAEDDYWRWVSSWAVSLSTPADLGYSDEGYVLPPMDIISIVVSVDDGDAPPGMLFANDGISATSIHKEKRRSINERSEETAGLVNGESSEPWIVWCDTDYEADALIARIPDAVEVRGSYPDHKKERNIELFSTGQARVIITKPSVCGHGLNWQHCARMAFVGVSYSFENFYQAARRTWRFGQTRPVRCYVINSEAEQCIWRTVIGKQEAHQQMQSKMSAAMRASQMELVRGIRKVETYNAGERMALPSWLNAKA